MGPGGIVGIVVAVLVIGGALAVMAYCFVNRWRTFRLLEELKVESEQEPNNYRPPTMQPVPETTDREPLVNHLPEHSGTIINLQVHLLPNTCRQLKVPRPYPA